MIEIFSDADSAKWNEIVSRSINGTLYHSWEWLKIVERHFNARLYPLVFFDDKKDDQPFGAIPLFHMIKYGFKMVFSPPPASIITLGPVLIDKGYRQRKFELSYLDFQSSIEGFIRKLGTNYTSMITSPGLLDTRPFSWDHYDVRPLYTYKIDLSQGEKEVWTKLSKELKVEIKKARDRGVSVIESNFNGEDIDYIYEAVKTRYREQHLSPPFKKGYLEELLHGVNRSSFLFLIAMYKGERAGSIILVKHKNTISGWVGNTRSKHPDGTEINSLMHWDAIVRAINSGYGWFENIGANTRHLCVNKSAFCPSLEIYFQIKRSNLLGSIAEKVYLLHRHHSYF